MGKLQESDMQHSWLKAVLPKPWLTDHSVGVLSGVTQVSAVEQFLFTLDTGIELDNTTVNRVQS